MVLKNNVINVFNNCIIARGAIVKCPSYLLSSRATPKYSIGLLGLEVYMPNLKR